MSVSNVNAPQDDARNRTPKERQRIQSERALKALTLAIGAGGLGIFIYSINSTGFRNALVFLGTGLMVAGASLLIGGLLGFLFGIPRTLQNVNSTGPRNVDNANPANSGQKQTPPAPAPAETDYQANTNLEQISDWLTKILVGVGLTQVRQISTKMYEVAGAVAGALGSPGGNRSFALSLMVYFLIVGFLFSYLWTRLYLPGAFREADSQDAKLDQILDKVEIVKAKTDIAQASAGLGIGKGPREEVQKTLLETGGQIQPGADQNDPWKGQFGGSSSNNNRQLSATVTPLAGSAGLYSIHLSVTTTSTSNPLTGVVQFFLHPTFNNQKPIVRVGPNSVAVLDIVAWGAFTVGALADNGQTRLELDLSELPDAPPGFRAS
jgi:pYEATS domain-containing protein involved in immunity